MERRSEAEEVARMEAERRSAVEAACVSADMRSPIEEACTTADTARLKQRGKPPRRRRPRTESERQKAT